MSGDIARFVAEAARHDTARPRAVRARLDASQPSATKLRAARIPRRPRARPGRSPRPVRTLSRRARGQVVAALQRARRRETCAEVGRALGVPPLIRLGKQARDDGANQSDNVVGDVVEALIGALFLDGGVRSREALRPRGLDALSRRPRPRAQAPQIGASGTRRRPRLTQAPVYEVVAAPAPITRRASSCASASAASAKRAPKARASRRRKPRPPPLC